LNCLGEYCLSDQRIGELFVISEIINLGTLIIPVKFQRTKDQIIKETGFCKNESLIKDKEIGREKKIRPGTRSKTQIIS